jgi:hypothetical protein
MSEQLIVGVDGSPASYTALRWVLAHAGHTGAQVHAMRCWTPVVAKRWEATITGEPVPPETEQQARAERELAEVVAAALAWVPEGSMRVAVRHGVVRGSAGPGLVGEADGCRPAGCRPQPTGLRTAAPVGELVLPAARDLPSTGHPPAMATRRTLTSATAQVAA